MSSIERQRKDRPPVYGRRYFFILPALTHWIVRKRIPILIRIALEGKIGHQFMVIGSEQVTAPRFLMGRMWVQFPSITFGL